MELMRTVCVWRWMCDSVGECGDKFKAVQAPTQDMKLAARGDQIDLHHHFTRWWKMLYHARKWTDSASLPSLQYVNFMSQIKNAKNEAMDGCVQNFDLECHST